MNFTHIKTKVALANYQYYQQCFMFLKYFLKRSALLINNSVYDTAENCQRF